MRTGWYREVGVKSRDCHEIRAVLLARSRLVAPRRDLENQMRGLLKPFGLLVGKARGRGFEGRLRELIAEAPAMAEVMDAVARKLAVMLHRMWCDETVFQWSTKEATA